MNAQAEQAEYIESLWWALHHSGDADRISAMLHCYLDESATDGGTPTAVVAGIVLEKDRFTWLDVEWGKVVAKHGVGPFVHMKDFGGHGRFSDWEADRRRNLFSDLVKVINEHKRYSIAATLSAPQYKAHLSNLPPGWKHSIYGMCFLMLAILQGKHAESNGYQGYIPYVMDEGNQYWAEVKTAHSFLINVFQKTHPVHIGSLAFDDDEKIRALQAADVIAWSVRRKLSGLPFGNGFEPLLEVIESPHIDQAIEESWMIELAEKTRARINS